MDENDIVLAKKDETLEVKPQENEIIKKPNSQKLNLSIIWSWLEDFPSFRISLVIVMGILILILLGVLFGYIAAAFKLIK